MRNHARTRTEQADKNFKRQGHGAHEVRFALCDREGRCDIMFAVWRSASELDRIDVLVIKGQAYLSAIVRDNQPLPPNSCVIECQGYAEAFSLRAVEH